MAWSEPQSLSALSLPPTVQASVAFIVAHARSLVNARRVWLFGSRGDGTAHPLSDIDVCVERGNAAAGWGALAALVDEEAPTLLSIDLVDLASCGHALRDSILRRGVLIYERRDDP